MAIRYYSRGGNTKKLARAIGEELGIPAETTEVPLNEDVDILFLGSFVYAYGVDDHVKVFINDIHVNIGRKIFESGRMHPDANDLSNCRDFVSRAVMGE